MGVVFLVCILNYVGVWKLPNNMMYNHVQPDASSVEEGTAGTGQSSVIVCLAHVVGIKFKAVELSITPETSVCKPLLG